MAFAESSTHSLCSFNDDDDDLKYTSSIDEASVPQVGWRQSAGSRASRPRWRKILPQTCTVSFLGLIIATISLSVAIASFPARIVDTHFMHELRTLDLGDCGSSWQEAESKGCVFDVMATDWIRAECKHKDLSDQLFAQGNWTFYRDAEATQVIPHEELLQGRVSPYYTEGAYHFSHCAYVWHKHVRAMGKKHMLLDSKSRNVQHSLHCLHMLAKSDITYISNKTSSKTVLGKSSTGDSVSCVAGVWLPPKESLAKGLKSMAFEH